mgnify:FL=1|jgi:uncharacterized membrane protein YGL010W
MANDLFNRQLASYASVHRDPRNKATHFIGIPVIVFSLLLILSLWRLEIGGREWTMSLIVAILAALGWMALDFGVGVVMAIILVPTWYAAEAFCGALGGPSATWVAFGALFVGGWVLQFLGHHYEGKRPALLDNIFQGFIGPMFLVAETMVALGYRADLADVMGEGEVRP